METHNMVAMPGLTHSKCPVFPGKTLQVCAPVQCSVQDRPPEVLEKIDPPAAAAIVREPLSLETRRLICFHGMRTCSTAIHACAYNVCAYNVRIYHQLDLHATTQTFAKRFCRLSSMLIARRPREIQWQ